MCISWIDRYECNCRYPAEVEHCGRQCYDPHTEIRFADGPCDGCNDTARWNAILEKKKHQLQEWLANEVMMENAWMEEPIDEGATGKPTAHQGWITAYRGLSGRKP